MELHPPSRGADTKSLVWILRGCRQPATVLGKLVHRVVVHRSHVEPSETAQERIVIGIGSHLDLGDPGLDASVSACDHSSEGVCQQLSTEADPERRQFAIDCVVQQDADVLQPGVAGGVMDAHIATQDDEAILLESQWDWFTIEGADQADPDSAVPQPRPPALKGV